MRTIIIARQIALVAALGFAAGAHAQLLGGGHLGGSLGGSLGGMVGGAGSLGGMGIPVTRVDSLSEARRAVRAPDTQSLRNGASLDGSLAATKQAGNAGAQAGQLAANGLGKLDGNGDIALGGGGAGNAAALPSARGLAAPAAQATGQGLASAGKQARGFTGSAIAGAGKTGGNASGTGSAGGTGKASGSGSASGNSGGNIGASVSFGGSGSASAGAGQ